MNFPVFDLHCDTALMLIGDDKHPAQSLRKNTYHIDLERAKSLYGYCQCFALFTTPDMVHWYGKSPVSIFETELDRILYQLDLNRDVIAQAYTANDVRNNYNRGLMSAVLTIEGPAGFDFDPALLEELYKVGFRITTLGWNEKNVLTGSHKTGGGLTELGREYVKEAQRLGMIIDVSHISDEGFWDIMDITQAPVVATHSNSRSICNVSRNLTDEMFLEICRTGGVAGFNQCAPFVGNTPVLSDVCPHFLHWMELDPDGKHIALGGDLDGCDELPIGFSGIQDYPAMANKLLKCGLSEQNLFDIYWNNAIGVMEACCM